MTDIEKYDHLRDAVLSCFETVKRGKYALTHGGCFWFASKVCECIPDANIVINRWQQHCAVRINNTIYDITGPINKSGFIDASEYDIDFMSKHFVSRLDLDALMCEHGIKFDDFKEVYYAR